MNGPGRSLVRRLSRLAVPAAMTAGALAATESCAGSYALRAAGREWSDFPPEAPARLECRLEAAAGARTLVLRQDDVKRADWQVALNGRALGALVADEHRQMRVFAIPPGALRAEGNVLTIGTDSSGTARDDIRVDRIQVHEKAPAAWLTSARVRVRVVDRDSGAPLPARITLADEERTLLPTGAASGGDLAVRTGAVYTASGEAEIPLPAGAYTVWASRGFSYGAAREEVRLAPGETRTLTLRLRREVTIPGWTAGDTHLHTRERSGHGDATVAERVITIAGEGLDWAVSTEHNLPANLPDPGDRYMAIRGFEMTTPRGHFNVFPWPEGETIPEPRAPWEELWRRLRAAPGAAIVWNHPRDAHSGYRPFDPARYITAAGEQTGGHVFGGNAMEVVNSGAMYSYPLELARDWMRLLNRGRRIAAVGSSDSHTVTTFAAGQARTYVRTGEGRPTGEAVAAAIARGETAVSYGLAAFLEERNGRLVATVYGPSWCRARRLLVYANGELIADRAIDGRAIGGLQWEGEVAAPARRRDAFLVAIATGGDVEVPFWPISRPYQPVTPEWAPMTLGVSPALRWDGDGDGVFRTAREQAEALLPLVDRPSEIGRALDEHDSAVAAQLGVLLAQGGRLNSLLAATGLPTRARTALEQVAAGWAAARPDR